ncbi:MAG: NAD-dependent succinate-semialdehyde dehydrogenase [Candidatus Dormibacteria bacterium]
MVTANSELITLNPATGAELERHPVASDTEIEAILEAVHRRRLSWASTPMTRRAELMGEAAAVMRRSPDLAATITAEMGKPITEARAEVEKCAVTCEHYAAHAEEYLADEAAPSDAQDSFIAFEPLGTVLAVMPWNFPLWQVIRFAAPALVAGNTAVLKHAANSSRSALNCERVFRQAGFPDDVFRTLLIPGDAVAAVIADPRIVAVTLTGSDATGAKVAAAAGENLKKTVLELGGSDAFIVLEDADVEAAAAIAVKSRFQNAGQSCIAAKRFIVVDTVADRFEAAMVDGVHALRVGDPTREDTTMGPLARSDLRVTFLDQIQRSVRAGATVATGGDGVPGPGFYAMPTVLTRCRAEMPAFAEETFGPLAAIMRVADEDAALAAANASHYGLGGNIWTSDSDRGIRLARRMETGGVFINGMTHSDPRLPFGGVKRSGYGRELHSFGIREFVNVKTIWVGPATPQNEH